MTNVITLTPGAGNWVCPPNLIGSVTVECYGGGATGGGVSGAISKGYGGAGGQYASSVLALTPGNSYAYSVGARKIGSYGAIQNGNDTSFGGGTVLAKGGVSYTGSSTGGVGTTVRAGGSGAPGNASYSGGGGGGGGKVSAGGTGSNAAGGTGGGGLADKGGAPVSNDSHGNTGLDCGGGGGGGCRVTTGNSNGGDGGGGSIVLTFNIVDAKHFFAF